MAEEESQAKYLAAYVRGLLAHEELSEAKFWFERLEAIQPNDPTTIELKAWLDVADGRADQAVATVQRHLQMPDFSFGPDWAARLFDRLATNSKDLSAKAALNDAAERLYQKAMADDSKQAAPAIMFLARQGRISEALDACDQWAEKGNVREALVTAVDIVNQPSANPSDRLRVERLIRSHIESGTDPLTLNTAIGTLYEAQKRFNEAIIAYRSALRIDSNDMISLNNLALLLAYRGEQREALSLIGRAIQQWGPLPALLDSRGTVRLALGDVERALTDYSSAAADQPSPTRWFHVALAQSRAQKTAEAKRAFKQAMDLGLTREALHPLERSEFDRLTSQFQL